MSVCWIRAGTVAFQKTGPEQSSKRLLLMLQSCGGSVPSNYKLVTDLVSDPSTRHRADSQGLLPRGLGISMRIKQESAERLEPGAAGNGK